MNLADGVAIYAAVVSTGAAVQGWRTWKRVPRPALELKDPVGQPPRDGLVEITCIAANRSPFPVGLDKGFVEWWAEPPVERFPEFLPKSVAQVVVTERRDEKTGGRVATVRAVVGPGRIELRELTEVEPGDSGSATAGSAAGDRLRTIRYRMRRDLSPAADEVVYPALVPQGDGLRLSAPVELALLPPRGEMDLIVITNEGGRFTRQIDSPLAAWGRHSRSQNLSISLTRQGLVRRALRRGG